MKLMKEDFLEHGFTEGCAGCKSIIRKTAQQSHFERCRTRMEKLLEDTEKGKQGKERLLKEKLSGSQVR